MSKETREKILIGFMVTLGSIVTFVSFLALVVTIAPIQVLSPWTATTDKLEYRLGEDVIIHSVGYKKFDMKGDATRTLTCRTDTRTSTYELNKSTNADIKSGPFDSYIPVSLPLTLDSIPRTCRIDIDVDYPWYGFKGQGNTNEFLIKE